MKIYRLARVDTIDQPQWFIEVDDDCLLNPQALWQVYFAKKGLHNTVDRANHHLPRSLSKLLELKENPLSLLHETLDFYHNTVKKQGIEQTDLGLQIVVKNWRKTYSHILSPIDSINCYRDFYTHEKHVKKGFAKRGEEIPPAWYEIPVYYKGNTKSFIGNGAAIPWPSFTEKLDYELELAAVIGRDGKNIKEENAWDHVFGFTILNDVSARDIQRKEMSVRLGPSKSKDFCSVIGPCIVTADELKDKMLKGKGLLMTAEINASEWSRGYSGEGYHSFSQMISFASKDEWLMASDLIGSGTVGTGCGLELDQWIAPGDQVKLTVEGIGSLENPISTQSV